MTAPTTSAPMKFEMSCELNGVEYQVWKSPMGYVVPFTDFIKYTEVCSEEINRAHKLGQTCIEEMNLGTAQFEETTHHIENRHQGHLKREAGERTMLQIALLIVALIAIALALALVVVLA